MQSNIADAFQRAEQSATYKRRRLAPLEKLTLDPAVLEYSTELSEFQGMFSISITR
jgi:hypothetical protein